jgi:transcriptional regulator with XRE-family HTH domain
MSDQPTLGSLIRWRRLDLGLTQEELAERVGDGTRQAEISRLEHDRIGLPRRSRLERIAVALELSIGELLAGSGWAGAEKLDWHRTQPSPNLSPYVPDPSPELSEGRAHSGAAFRNPLFTAELEAAIASARETSTRTRALLSRSEEMLNVVCDALSRTNSSAPREGTNSHHGSTN